MNALSKSSSFHLTQNVSSSQLVAASQSNADSVIHCAGQCLHSEFQGGTCNAFQLLDKSCKMMVLTELREKTVYDADWPGGVYVSTEARAVTPLYCHGGEDCCLAARNGPRQCEESEGDCSRDSDCAGLLVCGQDNCISQFGAQPGELYDYGDDCCTRRCTPDTPCTHGEVECTAY
jgi:hypothetical protein